MSLTPYHEPVVQPVAAPAPVVAPAAAPAPANHAAAGVHGSVPQAGSSSGEMVCLCYFVFSYLVKGSNYFFIINRLQI